MENLQMRMLLNEIKELRREFSLFLPQKMHIAELVKRTGKTRQGLLPYIYRNYEEGSDYWKEGKIVYVAREVALKIMLRHSDNQKQAA